MNIALAKLLMVAAYASAPEQTSCPPIEKAALNDRISAVAQSATSGDVTLPLGELSDYWESQCVQSRRNASRSHVRGLSGLLSIPIARLTVSSLLLDVDRNLEHSTSFIESAIADQVKLERRQEKEAYPYMPSTYRSVSRGLKCLKRKAITGKRDRSLCAYLDLRN